ncbi:LysR family transcriptional regulator [Actinoplanes palleronii]|uniref:LysR family transcriptional regulator n=1 Tax=Actinoplanes palleronii TaxID=113570 RepID=A0ABQ4B4K1_9ACTN|nr:LysR family transcriptional regulator [Actinoplanes palleronii]GIE65601.1 LysR family transcriptional regulator [Actinoplanes palleronii]
MELRQLKMFAALAEELHFGRAAARERVAQSGLSQSLKRLERELDVVLIERDTHHVHLTPAGRAFLAETRRVLLHLDRASAAAQRAARPVRRLRAGIVDASYESMPCILRRLEEQHPDLEVHTVEAGAWEQFDLLLDGVLDVAVGRATMAPVGIAAELLRLDPMGVLMLPGHRFAELPAVPVGRLEGEPLLMAERRRTADLRRFITDLCRSVGFPPTFYRGTVESVNAGADLVRRGRCLLCAPASCLPEPSGLAWRPLSAPAAPYPWSVLWREGDPSPMVGSVLACARALSRDRGWL